MTEYTEKRFWWKGAKFYELYIDKFAGTLRKLTGNLDYFNALGIDTLHILPHYPSPMVDDGYDISDYRGVRANLGTVEDFKNFLVTARAKGIRVIIDLVINHTSDQHPWFIEARSSRDNPKRNYYLWSDTGNEFENAINAFPMIKPHNWIRNEATGDNYFATFYPAQPDLNWENEEVFTEIISIMVFWADLGVDGFRIDAAAHLVKRQGTKSYGLPETHALLKRIRAALQTNYPEVILLAEAADESKDYFGNGDECHMVYNFALMRQMWLALLRGDSTAISTMEKDIRNIPENCEWAIFLRNHDEISLYGLGAAEYEALIVYLDPERRSMFGSSPAVRLADVYNGDKEKILAAFRLLYSVPAAPIMYYGDEIGMRNSPPMQGEKDARRYVRGAFDWSVASLQMKEPTSLFSQTAVLIHGTRPANK